MSSEQAISLCARNELPNKKQKQKQQKTNLLLPKEEPRPTDHQVPTTCHPPIHPFKYLPVPRSCPSI